MVMVQLQNLRPLNASVQASSAGIDVNIGPQSPQTSCQSILPAARMSGGSGPYLDSIGLNSRLISNLSNFSSQLKSSTLDQAQEVGSNPAFNQINAYLTALETTHIPSYRLVRNCLQEANQINVAEYDEQKARTEESKLRLEGMLHPEENVGYYEGWFPLFRPMREDTLFALFGVGLFLLLLAIGILLRFNGVEFNIILPSGGNFGTFSDYTPYMIGGLVVGILVGVLGVRRGWFNS
jgi:hypothetical protein